MHRSLRIVLTLLAFGLLSLICLIRNVPRVEADIGGRSLSALRGSGVPNVRLDVSGRDVHLFGSPTALERAVHAVSSVRGIRTTEVHPEGTDEPEPVETPAVDSARAAAVEADIRNQLAERSIRFRSGSAELLPSSRSILDEIADVLRRVPDLSIRVEGHTDDSGDAEANLALSQRRAEEVVRYLVAQGVAEAQLTPFGFGETRPVADNATPEGRQANRRIEFRVSQEN